MKPYSGSLTELVTSLWSNKSLIIALTKREITGRYKGSLFGLMWSFINPVFMLLVYTFFLSVVFKARWPGGTDSKTEFAIVLFAGLIPFNLFAECLNRSPSLAIGNVNYIKKVVFPLEILPLSIFGSAIFHMFASLLVWLLFYLIVIGVPPVTIFYAPIVLFPFFLLVLGITWFLTSIGVYVRDVAQFVGIVTSALMCLSPIFYPVQVLPEIVQNALQFSPLTFVVESLRDVMIWGNPPHWNVWLAYSLVSFIIFWSGFSWFQKTRKGFADVL